MKNQAHMLVASVILAAFATVLATDEARADTASLACTSVSASGPTPLNATIICPTFTGTGLQGIQLQVTGSFTVGSVSLLNTGTSDQTTTDTVNLPFSVGIVPGFASATFTSSDMTGPLVVPGGGSVTTFSNPTTTDLSGFFLSNLTNSSFFPLYESATPGSFAVPISTASPFEICSNNLVVCSAPNSPPPFNTTGATIATYDAGATVAYTFSPPSAVPEPCSFMLLGTGLITLLAGLRRRLIPSR